MARRAGATARDIARAENTPEMNQAGVAAYKRWLADDDPLNGRAGMVAAIWSEMEMLRRRSVSGTQGDRR